MHSTDLASSRLRILHRLRSTTRFCVRNPRISIGTLLILAMMMVSIAAPLMTALDPREMEPTSRLSRPSPARWFGADAYGRDLWTRTLYGGRVSLMLGVSVALMATILGLLIGLLSGYFRAADAVVMRIMDGMMAIPAIMLAIALATLTKPNIKTVIIAIAVPEVPRVVRLVRALALSVREQPYVEAAIASGTRTFRLLFRHILPNTLAPLMVQATYVCASAIITEAYLSFLGAGTPLEIPSWGNIMAEGRVYFHQAPWIILTPGIFVAVTVLAINILGDGLRDMLDVRMAPRL